MKIKVNNATSKKCLAFFLSLMELLPRTMILQPVSASSCLAVRPRGPRILPTKLNCEETSKVRENKRVLSVESICISHIWYEISAENLTRIWNHFQLHSRCDRTVCFYHCAHTHTFYMHIVQRFLITVQISWKDQHRDAEAATITSSRLKAQTIIPSANGSPIWKLWQNLMLTAAW